MNGKNGMRYDDDDGESDDEGMKGRKCWQDQKGKKE